ncbi:spore germination protein, partial [Aneurinibacillus migulanus]|nr:spore germination protein [Aneurinibacillus migulanus]
MKMRWWKSKSGQIQKYTEQSDKKQESPAPFTGDFTFDLELVRQEIGHNSDVHFREFNIGRMSIRA